LYPGFFRGRQKSFQGSALPRRSFVADAALFDFFRAKDDHFKPSSVREKAADEGAWGENDALSRRGHNGRENHQPGKRKDQIRLPPFFQRGVPPQ
jgi:hypothetical protein